ncbi:MAG: ATP-binding protein, partial [Nocardioidaceae bacterium]|nr:ATP-binding protein [Nocardioidaceae bacterium]
DRQRDRLRGTPWRRNADVPGGELRRRWPLPVETTAPLDEGPRAHRVSARGVDRVLRVAWTLADLAGLGLPGPDQVRLAVALRGDTPLPLPCPVGSAPEPATLP